MTRIRRYLKYCKSLKDAIGSRVAKKIGWEIFARYYSKTWSLIECGWSGSGRGSEFWLRWMVVPLTEKERIREETYLGVKKEKSWVHILTSIEVNESIWTSREWYHRRQGGWRFKKKNSNGIIGKSTKRICEVYYIWQYRGQEFLERSWNVESAKLGCNRLMGRG